MQNIIFKSILIAQMNNSDIVKRAMCFINVFGRDSHKPMYPVSTLYTLLM